MERRPIHPGEILSDELAEIDKTAKKIRNGEELSRPTVAAFRADTP